MDIDDFRSILESSGVDVWTFIDTAILVASLDYGEELKQRRDKIVERLFATAPCRNCDYGAAVGVGVGRESGSPITPPASGHGDDDGLDPYGGLFEDEQKRILEIKQHLEDPDQSEDSLVDLLQSLADMDITFQALKETDIGRNVNRLRKHPSNDVRRLVKQLVRRWKEIVDEWVRMNPQRENASSALMEIKPGREFNGTVSAADGDSPQQKISQNGHHQVADFLYSPNPNYGSSGSDKNNAESGKKQKAVPRRETPARPARQAVPIAAPAPQSIQGLREQQKESKFDSEKLASASRRLQENYKEAENAKRQRTIQVMDIHQIPKPRNAYLARNKGVGSQGRHW